MKVSISFCLASHYYIIVGEMQLRTMTLNSNICSVTVTRTDSLRGPADESVPFGCYDYLSLYHPEEHTAVMELIATVQKG